MTDQEKPTEPVKPTQEKETPELTDEELEDRRQQKIKQRIEELRKRDPFIYR